jgi:Cu/Ag efflux pump CusA
VQAGAEVAAGLSPAPGKEVLHPLAVVIFGGLISSTLLDSLLTPLMFWLWGEKPKPPHSFNPMARAV